MTYWSHWKLCCFWEKKTLSGRAGQEVGWQDDQEGWPLPGLLRQLLSQPLVSLNSAHPIDGKMNARGREQWVAYLSTPLESEDTTNHSTKATTHRATAVTLVVQCFSNVLKALGSISSTA